MLSLIAAIDNNGLIGINGRLPWRQKEDMKRFKYLTFGHLVICGRKTYESIPESLKHRLTMVVTRDQNYKPMHKGVLVASSLEEALERSKTLDANPFVIGGAQIYNEAIPHCKQIYLTNIKVDIPTSPSDSPVYCKKLLSIGKDPEFNDLLPSEWKLISSSTGTSDRYNKYDYTFNHYRR